MYAHMIFTLRYSRLHRYYIKRKLLTYFTWSVESLNSNDVIDFKHNFMSNSFRNSLLVQYYFWLFLEGVEIVIFTGTFFVKLPFKNSGRSLIVIFYRQMIMDSPPIVKNLLFPVFGLRSPYIFYLHIHTMALINSMSTIIFHKINKVITLL